MIILNLSWTHTCLKLIRRIRFEKSNYNRSWSNKWFSLEIYHGGQQCLECYTKITIENEIRSFESNSELDTLELLLHQNQFLLNDVKNVLRFSGVRLIDTRNGRYYIEDSDIEIDIDKWLKEGDDYIDKLYNSEE